ncbi:E3 ubiquitin-protein ligase DZIP3 isoform X2 [Echinops telfairi]|uniref:E3 ubiquitin-protein ligase DZIP3 isoform X2 n=1 Tax=Echinops telfairi TaxID=9371 RepID=A0AC55CPN6_ECHTE|nr:E3 ubiquitin-protein ligase DZIP3 isoform X2 [Echinops telfairi]
MDSLAEGFLGRDSLVEEQTKEETENKLEESIDQLDKLEEDTATDLVSMNLLLEMKRLLNTINALPKGVVLHIKKFLQEDFSFPIMQRDVASSQKAAGSAPPLTLNILITQLEVALKDIQVTDYMAHHINIGYYLTLLFLYAVALTERGTKEDYVEAESKFLLMKITIQENKICENFMSLVYFGRGLLRCAQKRYNGGLLEFYKSLHEIEDPSDYWFDIDPTEDDNLPTTFKDLLNNFIKTSESNITRQAICSYLDCERSCEADILQNTTYKGFVQLMCSKSCCIYFHKICWKRFRNLKYPGENDQNFSGKKCLKEECAGDIVRMLECDIPGIVKILFEVVRKDEYVTIENLGASYKKFMSLKRSETDRQPKISLNFSTKVSDILLRLGMKQEEIDKVKENPIENISLDYHQLSIYLGIPVPEIIQRMLSCYQQGIALHSITGCHCVEIEELQNEDGQLSLPCMEYDINMSSSPEVQLAEMNKDVASMPSESATASTKELQEVRSKPRKKKRTKSKKNQESNGEQVSHMVGEEEQVKKRQGSPPTVRFMNDDSSDAQEDSATEDKIYSLDELHILDMIEQGSTSKVTADYREPDQGRRALQRQIYTLHCQCEDFKKQLKTVSFHWQENQIQIKKKDKIISSLNQQVAFGINKVSKLQRQIHAKDNEIKNLKEQLSTRRSQWEVEKHNLESTMKTYLNKLNAETSRAITAEVYFLQCRRDFALLHLEQTEKECLGQLSRVTHMAASNLESLQLKAAVDSWNAIVIDVRNKIAFLKTQYNEQINKVKQGFALSTLPPVQLPPPPPHPDILMQRFLGRPLVKEAHFRPILTVPPMPAVCSGVIAAPAAPRAPLMTGIAWAVPAPVREALSPGAVLGSDRTTVNWERLVDRLKTAFPQQSRKELTDLLQKVKDANGKSFSALTFDEVVCKICQLIEPERSQTQDESALSGNCDSPRYSPQPNAAQSPKPAWGTLSSQGSDTWEGANNLDEDEDEEEPCVICHENLSAENLSVLPCAHKFHAQCIQPWLIQQGTCPTCRLHVFLPEEFPGPSGRQLSKI